MDYCLGIDESNHGRFPEIHAGVFSSHASDWRKGEYCKYRRKKLTINGELRENNLNRILRHTLTPYEHTQILGKDDLALISIAELIKSFFQTEFNSIGEANDLEKVLIDGDKDHYGREKLKELIYPLTPKIQFIPAGDQKYRIINLADMAAYRIFRGYTSNKKSYLDDSIADTLLTPDLDDYIDFFKQDRRFF